MKPILDRDGNPIADCPHLKLWRNGRSSATGKPVSKCARCKQRFTDGRKRRSHDEIVALLVPLLGKGIGVNEAARRTAVTPSRVSRYYRELRQRTT